MVSSIFELFKYLEYEYNEQDAHNLRVELKRYLAQHLMTKYTYDKCIEWLEEIEAQNE